MPVGVLIAIILGLTAPVVPLQAQGASLPSNVATVGVAASPRFPEPFTTVDLELDDYSINTTGAEILWFANGEEIVRARNTRATSYQVGALGETVDITVVIQRPNGRVVAEVSKTLTPARVDLIMEPDTMVSRHYRGAALPSTGSTVRMIALPHTANFRAPSEYTYLWKLNGKVILRGQTIGQNMVDINVPLRDNYVTVEVFDPNGQPVAATTQVIPVQSPEVLFYTENPLRGWEEFVTGSRYTMQNQQLTLHAVPFYFPQTDSGGDFDLTWDVNNQPVASRNPDPFSITLERQTGGEQATVDFSIQNTDLTNLFQSARGSVTIEL